MASSGTVLPEGHEQLLVQLQASYAAPTEAGDRFRVLADLIPQLVWVTDLSGNVEFTNQRWSEYTGSPVGDRDRATWQQVTHPDDLAFVREASAKALAEQTELKFEYRLRRADGEYRWHLAHTVFVRDAEGRPARRFGTATDIHEQKLEQERQQFFARASETLWRTHGKQERMDAATRLAADFFGGWCAVYELHDDGFIRLSSVANRDPAQADLARELDRRYPYRVEFPHPTSVVVRTGEGIHAPSIDPEEIRRNVPDREYAELLIALKLRSHMTLPLRTDRGTFGAIKVVSTDRSFSASDYAVAERLARKVGWAVDNARLTDERERDHERLEQAIRSRDDFLSIASHELRTPLTSLLLQTQMRLRRLGRGELETSSPSLERIFAMDEKQIRRLEHLIDDMLRIGQINSGKLQLRIEAFDLAESVRESALRHSEQARIQGCELTVDAPGPIRGSWDRFRIEQVFANLLSNALKYGKGHPIHVSAAIEGADAVLRVTDHGFGIDAKDRARIFDQFERAVSHTEVSGFGLGLYIVRKIVEAHSGRVGVESEPGKGSTFEIRLPLG